jgi:cytochrome b6-f complex iron-sulfur subunit
MRNAAGLLLAFTASGCLREGAASKRSQVPVDAGAELARNRPYYVPDARAWIVAVPREARERAELLLPDLRTDIQRGMLALSDRCPRRDARLNYCETAAWFECPNCGSQFDALGGKKGGPSPRGMSYYGLDFSPTGDVSIAIHPLYPGLPLDVLIVQQASAGPHCVGQLGP